MLPNDRKKSKSSIKAVIFDLGGVLVDWKREHLYQKIFPGDPVGMEHFLTKICPMEWNLKLDLGYPFARAVEEKVAEFPEYEQQIRAYHTRWEEMVPGHFPKTVELLAALRQRDVSLHVLSNFSAETYPLIRARYDFLGWFDSHMLSADVGLAKPDPAIYKLLLARIGRQPHECLFIDDSEVNVIAARDLGIDAIQFSSPDELRFQLENRGIV